MKNQESVFTGVEGKVYDIVRYEHTKSVDVHFKINDVHHIIALDPAIAWELGTDLIELANVIK